MKLIISQSQISENSIITKEIEKMDYQDSYLVKVNNLDSVDFIATQIFANGPKWSNKLLKVRYLIVKSCLIRFAKS